MRYHSTGTNYPNLVLRLQQQEIKSQIHIITNTTEYPSVAIAYLGKSCMISVGDSAEYRDCFGLAQLEYDVMRLSAFKKRLDASIELNLTMHEVVVLERRGSNKVRYRLRCKSKYELYWHCTDD